MPTNAITQPDDLTGGSLSLSDGDQRAFAARVEGDAVLACEGELDPATTPDLRRSLDCVLHLAPDRVVVDLSRVSFFDAGAIGALVQARATSRAAGGDLVVRAPTPSGRRVLGIVGLTDLIDHDPGGAASTDAAADVAPRRDELVAAWKAACASERYGAFPLVFDPTTVVSEILALLDDHEPVTAGTTLAAAATGAHETSGATAVMQLWALSDVVHSRIDTSGSGSEHEERDRLRLEAVLAAMARAALAQLEQATLVDPLTGLLNRRALDRDLPKSLAVAHRHAQCLSVVMIDVEGLKATNDRFGHAAGDETLRGVAGGLASALRAGEDAYRIGGDEFVLVLPELRPDGVDGVMERIDAGAQWAFTWGSAWVTGDEDAVSDTERAADLLEEADQRMLVNRARVDADRERVEGPDDLTRAEAEPTLDLSSRFTAANRSHVVIDEAKGLIAGHFDTGIREASIMLRVFSTAQGQSMLVAAEALMARTIDVARLGPHRLGRATTPHGGTDQAADDPAPARS